jgi:MFS family permease
MLIQALIFGGGHAGYANQPSYARVVELIIPSIGFGLLYLCFGLLTAVVLHYAFDVVWFALPLFVSTAPGIWIDRMLVIILALLPLWIVLAARLRAKKWQEIQEADRNQAWIPPAPSVVVEVEEKVPVGVLHPAVVRFLPIVGLIGLGMWIFLAKFQTDAPPVAVNRAAAEELGRQVLKEHGIELAAPWKVLSSVEAQPDQEDRFLWQTAGKETYSKFLGQYLPAPHWKVRFARFEGDVAERAEEYQVFIDGTGRVYRYRHQLPEDRPGKSLAENEARAIAHATLQKQYQLDAAAMKEVSAEPSKLKERTDWLFTFADIDKFKLQQGEARLAIKISGDQMTDAYRFVHVPEEWGRAERERRNIPDMLQMVLSVVMVLIVVAGAIGAVVSWSRKKFSAPMFFIMAVLILGLTLMGALNSFSSVTASFRTEQAYKVQVFLFGVTMVLGLLITSACVGLIAGLAAKWQESGTSLPVFTSWLIGISLGTLAAGLNAAAAKLAPSLSPAWAEYSGLSSYVPIANTSLELLSTYLVQSTIAVFIFAVIDKLSIHWTRHRWLCGILFIILGWILAGSSIGSIGSWLAAGAIVGIAYLAAYVFVLRFWLVGLVPIAVATGSILSALRHGMHQAYPQALLGAIIAVLLTAALSWYGFQRLLNKPPQTLSSAEQS